MNLNNQANKSPLPITQSHAIDFSKPIRKWDEPANLVIIVGPNMEKIWLDNLLDSASKKGLTVELIGDGNREVDLSEIDKCRQSGALGPSTQTIVALHGAVHEGMHILENSTNRNNTNTTEFLHRLRGNNESEKYNGTIHLISCSLGKTRNKIFKDQLLWNSGNYMLHSSSKEVALENASSNCLAIINYIGECKREHVEPDFSTMACRIHEVTGDSLTLAGSNLEAPLLLSAAWKPEHLIPDYLLTANISAKTGEKKKYITGAQADINSLIKAKKADRPSTEMHAIEKGMNTLSTRIDRKKFDDAIILMNQFSEFIKEAPKEKLPVFNIIDSDHVELLSMLIKAGATINLVDAENITPLAHACTKGATKSAKFLIENGADINGVFYEDEYNVLQLAVQFNNAALVKYLGNIDSDERTCFLNYQNIDGLSALHLAAINGNTEIIQILLDHGIDQGLEDNNGQSALWHAVNSGNIAAIKLLTNDKKMINLSDHDGFTPLHIAALKNNTEALKILIDANADVLKQTNAGHSVLHYAVSLGNDRATRILSRYSDLINLRDLEGKTSLAIALAINNSQIIRILKNVRATV